MAESQLRQTIRSAFNEAAHPRAKDGKWTGVEGEQHPVDALIERRNAIEAEVKQHSAALQKFPRENNGVVSLIPDHVKASPEYKTAKASYDKAFAALRDFNGKYATVINKRLKETGKRR